MNKKLKNGARVNCFYFKLMIQLPPCCPVIQRLLIQTCNKAGSKEKGEGDTDTDSDKKLNTDSLHSTNLPIASDLHANS